MLRSLLFLFSFLPLFILAQSSGQIQGTIQSKEGPLEYALVQIKNSAHGARSQADGRYLIQDIPFGEYTLVCSFLGYQVQTKTVTLSEQQAEIELNFDLQTSQHELDAIVVTGTKTFKRKTDSPVIVNIMDSKSLDNVQACNLSDGLKFQPGLRVETDCQTCNYTQLRMNGLAGGYSQILINGRPIFSPLTGLYGLEQVPVNLIDRIEVVRGGGSSLYGSSAVGGTVNVITKVPKEDSYELHYNFQQINEESSDHNFLANATVLSENKRSGTSFFLNRREREAYDHNADNFSELPELKNSALGANFFLLPTENQKLELSMSHLNEYRYGGEIVDGPAHLAQQSEERTHNVWMANADYQINFNQENSSFIGYFAWQDTDRDHYTGIIPDEPGDLENHLENPPYGDSKVSTYNFGLQLNHRIGNFWLGENTFTFGGEYVIDEVLDQIRAYRYLIDQRTEDLGLFVQSDWALAKGLTLLSGARMDKHNLVDELVISPRASILYKWKDYTKFRLNYGTGFRAPQAFDTDLHIAFAGGGISRVSLSPNLQPETSRSYSASINFDRPSERFVGGFTLEAFHTELNKAFILQPIGEDEFGERFEKQNGQGATVQGITLELRANFDRKAQIEAGLTVQNSRFENRVQYIDGLEGIRDFIRTPQEYGFIMLSLMPSKKWNANLNYVYTGSMRVPHFAGAPDQDVDEFLLSPEFHELSGKLAYRMDLKQSKNRLEFYAGVKNVSNAYQEYFDTGKNRDSNFVYGPAQPRTIFIGLKFGT